MNACSHVVRPRIALVVVMAAVLCATGACVKKFQPPVAPKRLILNDDGHIGFYSGKLTNAAALRNWPGKYRDTQLWIYQWGVMHGTKVNYPSRVSELGGEGVPPEVSARLRKGDRQAAAILCKLRDEGVDTLEKVAKGCHDAGFLCYASIRADGCYSEKYPGWSDGDVARNLNSQFWWDHPEHRIVFKRGFVHSNLSYAFPEVRERYLAIIREVLQRDIDGVDIDFLRHPPVLGYEEPLVNGFMAKYGTDPRKLPDLDERWLRFRCEVMTDFMRAVRREVNAASRARGRALGVSARVDCAKYLEWGWDLEAWVKEGLIDILIVGKHGLGGYTFDLTPFVRMAKGTECLVFVSEEGTVGGRDPTPQDEADRKAGKPVPASAKQRAMTLPEYYDRARQWYAQGAAGIHFFNEWRMELFQTLGDPALFPPPASPTNAVPSAPVR